MEEIFDYKAHVLSICCLSQVVEWLLGVVNHLPSEDQCQKCLVAPVDDKEKHDDMMLGRTKCYDLVTKVGTNQSQGERAFGVYCLDVGKAITKARGLISLFYHTKTLCGTVLYTETFRVQLYNVWTMLSTG